MISSEASYVYKRQATVLCRDNENQFVKLVRVNQEVYQFLLNKWYFDDLYELILVRPAKRLGSLLWKMGDGRVIDGFGPDGIAASVMNLARRASALQSGYLYHYAFAMLIGVAVLVSWYSTSTGGGH